MQYTKDQLSNKSLEELREIAKTLDIKTSGLSELALVYEILDKSAIVSAADSVSKQAASTRKRTRVKTVDKVYSANQVKSKKIDKTMKVPVDDSLFAALSPDEKKMLEITPEIPLETAPSKNEKQAEPDMVDVAQPKKRGRKPKQVVETEATLPFVEEEPKEDKVEAPKKRGRKKKEEGGEQTDDNKKDNTKDNENKVAKKSKKQEKTKDDFVVVEMVDETLPKPINDETQENKDNVLNGSNATSWASKNVQDNVVKPAEETDFIIIEDIPAEEYFIASSVMDIMKNNGKRSQNNTEQNNAKNNGLDKKSQSNEKVYDFKDVLTVSGVLEIVDNYGFLRSADYNYLASPDDVYVNQSQVKQYALKTGDVVEGTIRPPRDEEKFYPLVNIKKVNGCNPNVIRDRISFEYLTPLFPDKKFNLCSGDARDSISSRVVDLFAPIGMGQRALIVAQPKTGKTLLMKDIANSIARNHPDAYLMMLLIDERPEEVTDMARTVNAEVIASTFDAPAENHVKIAGLVLEKAKRMVECGHDVVIFLDSITRLARAYNTVSPASGKVLSGGVDANALQKPKRFFGAARNIENGGSLTIIATALIDTGSKMDEVIFEEFKGTGNMELQLDRTLSNKRVFPSVNLVASSTRRDDLLLDDIALRRMWVLRKHLSDMTPLEAMEFIITQMQNTKNNDELLLSMNG